MKIKINEKLMNYLVVIFGTLLGAFAYNVFFLKYNIVCFGISGLSIVLKEYGVDPNLFITICFIGLLLISFILLGYEKTKNSIFGSIMFPICVYLTAPLMNVIDLSGIELVVIAVIGAVISGFGYGLIYKYGFTTGGTDIINQILSKYLKTSIGTSMIFVDGIVVLSSKLVFGWETLMCGLIVLYIVSYMTDKVILGVSSSKAFYIVTEKEEEIRQLLLELNSGGVTLIDAHGGYTDKKKKLLFCVIPSKDYYVVKEALNKIDKNLFFLVTDAYEVSGKEI